MYISNLNYVSLQFEKVLADDWTWDVPVNFFIPYFLSTQLTRYCEKNGRMDLQTICNAMVLRSPSRLASLSPEPSNVLIRPLTIEEEAVDVALSHWLYAGKRAKENQKDIFDQNLFLGLFEDGELAGWIFVRRWNIKWFFSKRNIY